MSAPQGTEAAADESSMTVIRELNQHLTVASAPFAILGYANCGVRAVIMRLPSSGALVVFCPIMLCDEIKATITKMGGEVKYLVSGNVGHHMWLGDWVEAYPKAQIIAPVGLAESRKKQKLPELEFQYVLSKETKAQEGFLPKELVQDVDVEFLDGSTIGEIVLFHHAGKALMTGDMFWTLPAHEAYSKAPPSLSPTKGILTRFLGTIGWDDKIHGSFSMRLRHLLDWYALGSKDRSSYITSIQHMYNDWDFNILIPCHGDIIEKEGEAKRIFQSIFKWHLEATDKKTK
jgi:hypothetical protein